MCLDLPEAMQEPAALEANRKVARPARISIASRPQNWPNKWLGAREACLSHFSDQVVNRFPSGIRPGRATFLIDFTLQ